VAKRAESRLAPVRVIDLELDGVPEPLENLGDCVGLRALVRHAGVPVAWVELPVSHGRVEAGEVSRALAALRPETSRPAHADRKSTPLVTVAVCTRDRPDDLRRCLDALERIDYPLLELLVIDNAPATEAAKREVLSRNGRVRYAPEHRPGLSWARNRAIAEAKGEILAFTDDDVLVDPGWVTELVEAFGSDPEIMAVTGLVVPSELDTDAQVLFERYRSFGRGFSRVRVQAAPGATLAARYGLTGSFGAGANMAFRRRLFDEIGPFDPSLGPGALTRGGDDLEMFFRVLKAGHALVYEPRALVRHRHRRSMTELRAQMSDHGIGFAAYAVRSAAAYPHERVAFGRLSAWWLAKVLYRALHPRGAPAGPMRRLALAELAGLFRGPGCYRRARAATRAVDDGACKPAMESA
jgi:GT2 family glycosyltransferase